MTMQGPRGDRLAWYRNKPLMVLIWLGVAVLAVLWVLVFAGVLNPAPGDLLP